MSCPPLPESARDLPVPASHPQDLPASPARNQEARAAAALPPELWLDDLRRAAQEELTWLWHGYLAAGGVTLLTSLWKSGKTTLVSVLLARLKSGGQLAGRALAAGKAVVVSEESPAQWLLRSRQLDFAGQVCWLCRPFRGKPSSDQWLALLDRLAELRHRQGVALVVIDPLAAFLPGRDESGAAGMLAALAPLQRLTTLGMSVLLLHHPRKKESAAGLAARGSGALPGFADILIEMDWYHRGDLDDRRRRLRGYSRFAETPRHLVIELNADGTDYLACGDFHEEEFTQSWERLRQVLEDAAGKLTRREILAEWPDDLERPDGTTVWQWLQRAVARGLVRQEETGRKNDPFRYWLPGQEAKWRRRPVPLPELAELELLQETQVPLARRMRQRRKEKDG
jgi:hypothetical protein